MFVFSDIFLLRNIGRRLLEGRVEKRIIYVFTICRNFAIIKQFGDLVKNSYK